MSRPGALGPDAVRRELAEVARAVALADRAARAGEFVDLAGLDGRVDALCAAVRTLPGTDGRAVEPQLLGLIDGLTRLAEALADQAGRTAAAPAGTGTPGAAAAAYRKRQG